MQEKGKRRLNIHTRRNALTVRYGAFIGQSARVTRKQIPPGPNDVNRYCRLCWGARDTGYHAIGGCKDARINNIITARHDKVVRLIEKAMRKGRLGAYKLLVHAGKHDELEQTPTQRTVPDCLLPGCSLCPDLMLIRGWQQRDDTAPGQDNALITLIPAEVAVCCDDFALATVQKKHEYYAELIQQLRAAGWRVLGQNDDGTISDTAPYIITMPFGSTGMTYEPTITALSALGIQATAAQNLQKDISRTVSRTISTILATKKELERQLPPDQGPPCPPSQLPYKPSPPTTFTQGRPTNNQTTTPADRPPQTRQTTQPATSSRQRVPRSTAPPTQAHRSATAPAPPAAAAQTRPTRRAAPAQPAPPPPPVRTQTAQHQHATRSSATTRHAQEPHNADTHNRARNATIASTPAPRPRSAPKLPRNAQHASKLRRTSRHQHASTSRADTHNPYKRTWTKAFSTPSDTPAQHRNTRPRAQQQPTRPAQPTTAPAIFRTMKLRQRTHQPAPSTPHRNSTNTTTNASPTRASMQQRTQSHTSSPSQPKRGVG